MITLPNTIRASTNKVITHLSPQPILSKSMIRVKIRPKSLLTMEPSSSPLPNSSHRAISIISDKRRISLQTSVKVKSVRLGPNDNVTVSPLRLVDVDKGGAVSLRVEVDFVLGAAGVLHVEPGGVKVLRVVPRVRATDLHAVPWAAPASGGTEQSLNIALTRAGCVRKLAAVAPDLNAVEPGDRVMDHINYTSVHKAVGVT